MEPLFPLAKHIHVWCVTISFALFVVRAVWRLSKSPMLKHTVVRTGPHLVDTLLLATGLVMVFSIGYHASLPSWLVVKFVVIILYIVTGIFYFRLERFSKITLPLALGFFFTTAYLAINKPIIW